MEKHICYYGKKLVARAIVQGVEKKRMPTEEGMEFIQE